MGWQRIQNGFCKGFGYPSQYDLVHDLTIAVRANDWVHSRNELEERFDKGFALAIELASERGFLSDRSSHELAAEAADQAVRWNEAYIEKARSASAADSSKPNML